ncbi:MAG: phospholipase D-like domain-containing protein [Patescibacteria group bacterium]
MAEAIISGNKKLFEKVRALNLPAGEYALFGSAPLGIRRLKECNDVDAIVSSSLFDSLRYAPGWEVKSTVDCREYLKFGDDIEFWKDWHPGLWDIPALIRDAEIIDGLPFVKLHRVLEWKKIFGREKDIADVILIEQYLGAWKFYLSPKEAWRVMLEDCAAASRTIDIESYIFSVDDAGMRFADIFMKKAKEGVRVRVLCDMVGSYGFFNSPTAKSLAGNGVEIRFFNPISPWRVNKFFSWFRRDHRKILVVDSKVGYTGGVNIAARMADWRDTHVRFEGAMVLNIQSSFERMWAMTRRKRFIRHRDQNNSSPDFLFLTSSPRLRQRFIYRNMIKVLRNAKRYIYISTPYFVPTLRLFQTLITAAKRGVDVRILLPEKSDVRTVDIASGSYFTLALKSGVKIYQYQNSVFHVKTCVVDEEWATVGSANLDNVSLFFNYEANFVSREKSFVEELRAHFVKDLESSRELQYTEWINRPLSLKFLELATWPIHRML